MNRMECFLSETRQHPGVPCEALKFFLQLPSFFLEKVVPAGVYLLQT